MSYNRVIELEPNNDYGYFQKGVILANLGLSDEALEAFNRAIELDPKDTLYLKSKNLGSVEFLSNRFG